MSVTVRSVYDGSQIVGSSPKLERFKERLEVGQTVVVEYYLARNYRTKLQQGLVHSLMSRLARGQGESLQHTKMKLKISLGYYIPAEKMISGEIGPPRWPGRFVDLHALFPEFYGELSLVYVQSESSYSKEQESELIEFTILSCNVAGVDISDILESLAEMRRALEDERQREKERRDTTDG